MLPEICVVTLAQKLSTKRRQLDWLDRRRDAVRVRPLGARQPVEQPLDAVFPYHSLTPGSHTYEQHQNPNQALLLQARKDQSISEPTAER